MSCIEIQSPEHWQAQRKGRVGASEVPILYGCGYRTLFEYWHQTRGSLPAENLEDDEGVLLGKCLEDGIARAAVQQFSLRLIKANTYYTDDLFPRLGATPDFLLAEAVRTPVEIKNVSWGAWKQEWYTHADGSIEPPLKFRLQCQTQMACMDAPHGLLIALVAGNHLVRAKLDRDEPLIASIREQVTAFWQSITDGIEPPAIMPEDYYSAQHAWRSGSGSVDLSGDPQMEGWLHDLNELRAARKRIEVDETCLRGQILAFCQQQGLAAIRAHNGKVNRFPTLRITTTDPLAYS